MKHLAVLGSTGSIGQQALAVVRQLNHNSSGAVRVTVLAAHSNIALLETQIREFLPDLAVVFEEKYAETLKQSIRDLKTRVLVGMKGLCEAAAYEENDLVLNAVVGIIGLQPTLSAIQNHVDVALANKESLVAAGRLVMDAVRKNNVRLIPVDSEHSAIFQCLQGNSSNDIKRIILTASGGPFFGRKKDELLGIRPQDALKHPNWSMGAKITIDSATMMNKGLEVIEAAWLFGLPVDKIDVVIHRESIIHSMVEYHDNTVLAQMGVPDMSIPIQYALTYPARETSPAGELDLLKLGTLSFYKPDLDTFRCLKLCIEAKKRGGVYPAAVNGANETAVQLFLEGRISFLEIPSLVEAALENQQPMDAAILDNVLCADRTARAYIKSLV